MFYREALKLNTLPESIDRMTLRQMTALFSDQEATDEDARGMMTVLAILEATSNGQVKRKENAAH